jgi:nucleotide-binding universal stress UspA family protein
MKSRSLNWRGMSEMTKTEANQTPAFTSPTTAAPVLVGFDGADGGRDALELARVLSSVRNTRCIAALANPDLAEQAVGGLDGVEVDTQVIGALSPGRMLVERAEKEHAGTVVVGATRRGRVGRAFLGSTAVQVLHHAPCEVIVAPPGYASIRHPGLTKIAVAVDGLEESKVALTRAEDLARQAGATIEVLVASDPVVSSVEAQFPQDAPSSMSDVLEAAVRSIDPALSPTGRKIDSGRRQVARSIAAALAEACSPDVDLLVAGAHRTRDHFLLGSVTKRLIKEAPCPVLVVPHS